MLKFNLIRKNKLPHQPLRTQFDKWLRASLLRKYATTIISISIVDNETSRELNNEYRGIDKPTNVISLEYARAREEFNLLSGELILCDEVIVREAREQNKPVLAHYAHMLLHGMLHLQGLDHQIESEADTMEQIEIAILAKLGFSNPYGENN